MVDLQESENVLVLIRKDKPKLFYDAFGMVLFLILRLSLINPHQNLNLTNDDLLISRFTALGGIIFCLLFVLTGEHTSRWTFDKNLFRLMVEHQGLIRCRRFEYPLEQIRSVKVLYPTTGKVQIIFPDLEPVPLSIEKIPVEKVNGYAKLIKNFLTLDE
jgi:hypothetical protein